MFQKICDDIYIWSLPIDQYFQKAANIVTIDVQLPNSQPSDITLNFEMGAVAKIYFEFTELYMKHGNCSIFFHVLKLAVTVVVRMVIPV